MPQPIPPATLKPGWWYYNATSHTWWRYDMQTNAWQERAVTVTRNNIPIDLDKEKEQHMQLFEYAVVRRPKEGSPTVVIEPSTKMAWSHDAMMLLIGRELPEDVLDHIDELEITIKPFNSGTLSAAMPYPQEAVFAQHTHELRRY